MLSYILNRNVSIYPIPYMIISIGIPSIVLGYSINRFMNLD